MDLGEAIYREITGGEPSHTEISGWGDAIGYLVERFGSASAAGRATGFPQSSFRHWVSSGRVPGAEKRADVIEAALLQQRRDRLPHDRENQMRRAGAMDGVRMVGALTYDSAPEPDRDVDLGAYLDEVQDAVLDAYLDGASVEELAEIFVDGINDQFYHDTLSGEDPHLGWDIDDLGGWA